MAAHAEGEADRMAQLSMEPELARIPCASVMKVSIWRGGIAERSLLGQASTILG